MESPPPVELHEVFTQEEAVEPAFPGSPTIRVDGVDIDPSAPRAAAQPDLSGLPLSGRRPSPVPSREQLEEALT